MSNHILLLLVTLLVIGLLFVVFVGYPYLRYIYLVANADTTEGVNRLAKHLAHRTGGKKINVDDHWPDFIPAAQGLHNRYKHRLTM